MKSFQPLSYIANAAPRNVTGHGRGEGEMQSISFAKIQVYSHGFFYLFATVVSTFCRLYWKLMGYMN